MSREEGVGRRTAVKCHSFIRPTWRRCLRVHVSAHVSECMCACGRVFEIILSYWTINQPSLPSVNNFFKMPNFNKVRKTQTQKKSLAKKIPPFVIQV